MSTVALLGKMTAVMMIKGIPQFGDGAYRLYCSNRDSDMGFVFVEQMVKCMHEALLGNNTVCVEIWAKHLL